MNGLEVQTRLRDTSPSTRAINFIGKDDPLVHSTAMEADASTFFIQLFDDEGFFTEIRMALAVSIEVQPVNKQYT